MQLRKAQVRFAFLGLLLVSACRGGLAPATILVTLTPSAATLVAGARQAFTCQVTGASDPACSWAVHEGSAGGTISDGGVYTAPSSAGTFHVVATSHADPTSSAVAAVTVVSAVAVTVGPTAITLLEGATQTFTCSVTGASDPACSWSVTEGTTGGTITSAGVYTAPLTPGTYHVVAKSHFDEARTATATVTVQAASQPVVVTVGPRAVTLYEGGTEAFTCTVLDSADTACSWSVQEGSAGGTVSSGGLYTAPATAGTYHVVATSHADNTKSDAATVTVTAPPPPVFVSVSPRAVSLLESATQAFACTVTNSADAACLWSVQEGSAGGSISSGGLYTAPNSAGTYHVVGTSHADASKSDTATITVTPPPISVSVSPHAVALLEGGGQSFTCTVSRSSDLSCLWSVQEGSSGGTVSSVGGYLAPSTAGTYHVVATSHADNTKSDAATVTVTAAVSPIAVSVSPHTLSLVGGTSSTFNCTVTNSVDTACLWSVQEGAAGGSINGGGYYTAPFVFGTYHVVATSHADPSKSDTATVAVSAAGPLGVTVDFSDIQQHIDGFGGCDSHIGALSDAQADLLFSPTLGIGLSLLRMGIDTNGGFSWSNPNNAKKAIARGALVWAAPWSPSATWKTTGSANTGSLSAAHYGDWADKLVSFYNAAKSQGIPIYAISAQNEPDYNTNGAYEMCLYDGNEMRDFVKVLGPKLAALNPRPLLIAPESSNWGNLWGNLNFLGAIQADAAATSYLDIAATHQYGVYENLPVHALFPAKPLWETEVSSFDAPSSDITNGITVAKWIHAALVKGQVSAWHYWWLINQNNDNEGLLATGGGITKRLYSMGNYSKFIRPGYVRIGTTGGPPGIDVSAYKNPVTGDFAIVAINDSGAAIQLAVTLSGTGSSSVTPMLTSATSNLAAQPAVAVASGGFTSTLPVASVVTFVGKGP